MKRVLLTGASSFTGTWLADALAGRHTEVIAPLARDYAGSGDAAHWLRQARLAKIADAVRTFENCPFGGPDFLNLIDKMAPFHVAILHGAQVGEFRSGDFDVEAAVASNTRNLEAVLDRLIASGCNRLIVTGSVFEAGEGMGDVPLEAIGSYGLAKSRTWTIIERAAGVRGMALGKFVIPHPFGALEKPGLVSHLLLSWLNGAPGSVRHPNLARDFVHVDQLCDAYAKFALALPSSPGLFRRAPSGYRETIGKFAERLACEMRPRLGRPCLVDLTKPERLPGEPMTRQNTDVSIGSEEWWNYAKSWDLLAEFYGCGQVCALSRAGRVINL